MAVLNVHERAFSAEPSALAPYVDGLSGPGDPTWPHQWPALRMDRPLGAGARGGHGPVRYDVTGYAAGQWVRFGFQGPRGFHGWHEFTVHPTDGGGCVLRNTLTMRVRGPARLSWPLLYRWCHDALIEDALDRAERSVTGTLAAPARWNPYVRLLRFAISVARRTRARRRR